VRGQRGVALILVLWLLVLLTALLANFAVVSRTEATLARELRDTTRATYAAEAGVEIAVVRLSTPDIEQRWVPDGRTYEVEFDDARIEVTVLDEGAKLDLNVADAAALQRFFAALGLDEMRAARMADVIIDFRDADDLAQPMGAERDEYAAAGMAWGPKNDAFTQVQELRQVIDMTPGLYRRMAPHVTVHTRALPNPAFAAAPVLAAVGYTPDEVEALLAERGMWLGIGSDTPMAPDATGAMVGHGSGTYSIRSVARLPDGAKAELNVVLRTMSMGMSGETFTVLERTEGEAHH